MERSTITYGPELEQTYITAGLDYYKPTMSQFVHEYEPNAEATFTFKNRGEQRLLDYVDPTKLQTKLDRIRERGFNTSELEFLGGLTNADGERMFADEYLTYIQNNQLPEITVKTVDDDLDIQTTGDWTTTSFWETIVMSQVNELYFENYVTDNGIDLMELYAEGDRLLDEKVAYFQANPHIKISEFGTRRRFSLRWQRHVIERLSTECPENFVGTSNVAFANTMGLKPIGTFAHELPMGYAGLADARGQNIRDSHGNMLDEWYDFYGDELAIALSDTFGSDFFFETFTPQRSNNYKGTRHDSGDPLEYAQKAVDHYRKIGIAPTAKTVLFSDGLDVKTIDTIDQELKNTVPHPYGVGTNLTNDLGVKALNVVMKLTHIEDTVIGRGEDTVKLSDNPGKHTGPIEKITEYQEIFQKAEVRHGNALATV